jgi:hypothetical protein
MKRIAETFKVTLNNEMQKYQNYANMMVYNEFVNHDQNGRIALVGSVPDRSQVDQFIILVRHFIAFTDMRIFESYISNKLFIREIYSWEQNRYITPEERSDSIWQNMINPLNSHSFSKVFPDVVSNILVLRNASLAVQSDTQARIGFNLISIPNKRKIIGISGRNIIIRRSFDISQRTASFF